MVQMSNSALQGSTAIVKSVLSADTLCLRGKPVNGPPPEKLFSLSNVMAPRLNLKEPEKDEPFAFQSREFVRKLVVGKQVQFSIEYTTATNAREFGSILLNPPHNGESDLTSILVQEGWVRVKDSKYESNEKQVKLLELQQEAQAAKRGIWADSPGSRQASLTVEGEPKAFLQKYKGQPLPGILEQCRDASTFRACIQTPDGAYFYITLQLSGVKSPILRKGVPNMEDLVEPYAEEGRFFVESRLLQRDVKIILEGVPPSSVEGASYPMFIGSIDFSAGNISEALLAEGFAKVNDWTLSIVTNGHEKYRAAEKRAKEKRVRLWKDYVAPATTGATSGIGSVFNAVVIRILGPDLLVVEAVKDKQERKLQLSSVRGPKRQKNDAGLEVGYYSEAVEFLRSRLIGNAVQVTIDYVKPAEGEYEARDCATIMNGSQNIAEALISRGLAQVIRHRREDDNRSSKYDSLLIAEDRAQSSKKGLWSEKEPPTQRITDASESAAKAKQFLPFFQKSGDLTAGIRVPRAGGSGSLSKSEPYGPEALAFVTRQVLQRDVAINIDNIDKTGGFIGTLTLKEPASNVAVMLLSQGLAYIHEYSASQLSYASELFETEKKAKAAKIGLWKDYNPNLENESQEDLANSTESLQISDEKSVMVSEISLDGKIYVQIMGDGATKLEKMMAAFSTAYQGPGAGPNSVRTGDYVAAKFTLDDQFYRAQVLSVNRDKVQVLYIDYGNSETVPLSHIRPLQPQFSLQSLSPQAKECQLAYIEVPKEDDEFFAQFVKELKTLTEGKVLTAKFLGGAKSKANQVVLFSNKKSVNECLVRQGLAFVNRKTERQQALAYQASVKAGRAHLMTKDDIALLIEAQDLAKKEHLHLWRYGDFREDDEDL